MKEMKKAVEHNGKTLFLYFNLNVMEEIQSEYGTLEKWGNLTDGNGGECDIKALIFGFRAMINEGIDIENERTGKNEPMITSKQAGRLLTDIGLENMTETMNALVIESSATGDEKNA